MSILRYGIIDIINSFRKYDLIRMLGRQYMVLRYRRSKLGPFWITISMGIQILTLGLIVPHPLYRCYDTHLRGVLDRNPHR